MKKEILVLEDAYVVGNVPDPNLNFGKKDKLYICADSCKPKMAPAGVSYYHEVAWTYLKFKLPEDIDPQWVTNLTLHLYIPDARFVGSTVGVYGLALRIMSCSPNWSENTITWANKPEGSFITLHTLKSCEELGDLCGKTGWCQVGPSFNLGHVNIPLPFWSFDGQYISFILQPGRDNNCMYAYSKEANVKQELKPSLIVEYEPHETPVEPIEEEPTQVDFEEKPVEKPKDKYVKVSLNYVRGIRTLIVKINQITKLLKPHQTLNLKAKKGLVFDIVIFPRGGIVGYKATLKVKEGKEVTAGGVGLWCVRIANVELAQQS